METITKLGTSTTGTKHGSLFAPTDSGITFTITGADDKKRHATVALSFTDALEVAEQVMDWSHE
jgi:hypothetical protein